MLDVTRDLRWGRTEETIGEDPLPRRHRRVGVRPRPGVRRRRRHPQALRRLLRLARRTQPRAGVDRSARDRRRAAAALRDGAARRGARSVMNSYTDIDGVPDRRGRRRSSPTCCAARAASTAPSSRTTSRVAFLETLHARRDGSGEAAGLALKAGIDVELPTVNCYGAAAARRRRRRRRRRGAHRPGRRARAASEGRARPARPGLAPGAVRAATPTRSTLDDAESRALARGSPQRSVVLLSNDGTLPLRPTVARVAVVGPRADERSAMLGCYSFPRTSARSTPTCRWASTLPTVLRRAQPVTGRLPFALRLARCSTATTSEIAAAVAAAARTPTSASPCSGDLAGLFGAARRARAATPRTCALPGRQEELLEALLATGDPGGARAARSAAPTSCRARRTGSPPWCAAFFPGEEGAARIAGVLTGGQPVRPPAGQLPRRRRDAAVDLPRRPARRGAARSAPSTRRRCSRSAHGLSYAPVTWARSRPRTTGVDDRRHRRGERLAAERARPTDHRGRPGVPARPAVAEVVRPVQQLVGRPGRPRAGCSAAPCVRPARGPDLLHRRDRRRLVEPGVVELRVGASSEDVRATVKVDLVGPRREVGFDRVLAPTVTGRT